jgi:hypothetical protein
MLDIQKPKWQTLKKISLLAFGLVFLFFNVGGPIFADSLPECDLHSIYGPWVNYVSNDCDTIEVCSGSGLTDSTASPTQTQIDNAKVIIGIAKTEGLGQQGALIGLMAGLAESGLRVLANSKIPLSLAIPHQGVGSDGLSVGIYQQQPQYGWSTIATGDAALSNPQAIAQLMDPAYSAEAFFGSPPGTKAPSALSKGLQNKSGWQTMDPAVAATLVQGNRDGAGTYRPQIPAAQALLTQLWDSSPPIPLPVPLNAPPGDSTGISSAGLVCSGVSGNAQELARQILQSPNIDLSGRLVKEDIQAAADGKPGSAGVMTSSAILKLILEVGQTHKVTVSAIQSGGTGHCDNKPKPACPNDPHYTGDAVDFSTLDGKALTGRDSGSIIIIQVAFKDLPSGSGIGQKNCGPTPSLPPGWITFDDSCNHLHVQAPKGTP